MKVIITLIIVLLAIANLAGVWGDLARTARIDKLESRVAAQEHLK